MFQDIKVSNDLNQGFKKEYQDKGDIAGKLLFAIKCFLPLSQAYKLWAHHVAYTRVFYKIIQIVRALWLVIKLFYMGVCKHGFRSSFISFLFRFLFSFSFLFKLETTPLRVVVSYVYLVFSQPLKCLHQAM